MKRILAFFLCLSLSLSFCSCSKKSDASSSSSGKTPFPSYTLPDISSEQSSSLSSDQFVSSETDTSSGEFNPTDFPADIRYEYPSSPCPTPEGAPEPFSFTYEDKTITVSYRAVTNIPHVENENYHYIPSFKNGYAFVVSEYDENGGLFRAFNYDIIDYDGNIVGTTKNLPYSGFASPFTSEGYALSMQRPYIDGGKYYVEWSTYYMINTKGEIVKKDIQLDPETYDCWFGRSGNKYEYSYELDKYFVCAVKNKAIQLAVLDSDKYSTKELLSDEMSNYFITTPFTTEAVTLPIPEYYYTSIDHYFLRSAEGHIICEYNGCYAILEISIA